MCCAACFAGFAYPTCPTDPLLLSHVTHFIRVPITRRTDARKQRPCSHTMVQWLKLFPSCVGGSGEPGGKAQDAKNQQLLKAAALGLTLIVTQLVLEGAHSEAQDSAGRTPLHLAAVNGHAATVRALLAAGAEPNSGWGDKGWRAVHAAAAMGHSKVIEELVAGGAAVDARSTQGITALMAAAGYGQLLAMTALLSAGANKEAKLSGGFTAVHYAAQHGQEAAVRLLVTAGADMETRAGRHLMTAVHLAAEHGHAHVVCALAALGANLNTWDGRGRTPLDCFLRKAASSAVHGAVDGLLRLLQAGADPFVGGSKYYTALEGILKTIAAHPKWELQPYLPHVIRVLAEAGCPVDDDHEKHSPIVCWLRNLLKKSWSEQPCKISMDICVVLLQAADEQYAVADGQGISRVHGIPLCFAAMSGSCELVQAVLLAFPWIPSRWKLEVPRLPDPLILALAALSCTLAGLQQPPGVPRLRTKDVIWPRVHQIAVERCYKVVKVLQAAGWDVPANWDWENSESRRSYAGVFQELNPGKASALLPARKPPQWCLKVLRELLPLLAHKGQAPSVRATLQQMLLINTCRGFPVLQEHTAQPVWRVVLPAEVLRHILVLAASTPEAWLAQLNEQLAAWRASQRAAEADAKTFTRAGHGYGCWA